MECIHVAYAHGGEHQDEPRSALQDGAVQTKQARQGSHFFDLGVDLNPGFPLWGNSAWVQLCPNGSKMGAFGSLPAEPLSKSERFSGRGRHRLMSQSELSQSTRGQIIERDTLLSYDHDYGKNTPTTIIERPYAA